MNIISVPDSDDEVVRWHQDYTLSSPERPIGSFQIPSDLTRRIDTKRFPEGGTRYGLKALTAECKRVVEAGEGARNTTLWSSGCSIGRLVGGGELDLHRALAELRQAALSSGLCEDEIERVLVRPAGAIQTGILEPRNRFGSLADQFLSRMLSPSSFNQNLFVLDSLDFWHDALNDEAPGFQSLNVQWQIEQLGVIYWANYLYFLNEIHLLALSRAKGARHVYQLLSDQYFAQASEWERMFVEIDFGLGSVVANTPPISLGISLRVHDAKRNVEQAK